MSEASRVHHTLERRIVRLEQHVDDLTRAVERLNEALIEDRNDDHVLELFDGHRHDGTLPELGRRVDH